MLIISSPQNAGLTLNPPLVCTTDLGTWAFELDGTKVLVSFQDYWYR